MSWEECKRVISEGRLEVLGRSMAQQEQYNAFMEGVRKEFETVHDFILVTKFGLDASAVNSETGKRSVPTPIDISNDVIKLFLNDFPYNFTSDVKHYVLWKLGSPLEEKEVRDAQESLLQDDSLGADDACFYVNPPHLKSILTIDHAHILLHVPGKANE